MAGPTKGSVAGQPIRTGDLTPEYEAGHERTFGEPDPKFPRGRRFKWDPWQKKLVPVGFVEEKKAIHASIVTDRHYENTCATDGTDIGSRRKHRDYMRRNNLTTVDDFKETWSTAAREREAIRNGEHDRKERREAIGRALYEHEKP